MDEPPKVSQLRSAKRGDGPVAKIVISPAAKSKLDQIRDLLLSTKLDPNFELIDDRDKFRATFGMGFSWDRPQREALIRFKRAYDLGVNGVSYLFHTGSLNRNGSDIELAPSLPLAFWGLVLLVLFGTLTICCAAILWPSLSSIGPNTVAAWSALTWMFIQCILLYVAYVHPWIFCRRISRCPTKKTQPAD